MSKQNDHHGPNHQYHLVDPSPWPIVGSFSAFVLVMGLVFWMKDIMGLQTGNPDIATGMEGLPYYIPIMPGLFHLPTVLLPGIFLVGMTMWGWWRDVIREGEHEGHHTPIVQIGLRYGMILFIASEVMFFAAFFWAFFDFSMFPRGVSWPPEGIEALNPLDLPLYNTLLLLLSGTTVTWAHHALREGDRRMFLIALGITIFLGVVFTAAQIVEYYEATFTLQSGTYGTTFYLATGFHGFHVIVGTIFLFVCWMRGRRGHFKSDHHFGFEAAAWYWHFVDVVWIFLFVSVYFGVFSKLATG